MSDEFVGQKKVNNKKIIIISLVIIIVFVAIVIYLSINKINEPKRNIVVTKDNVEDVVNEMLDKEYIEPGYYSASMSTTWHFAASDAASEDAYVENVKENTNDVYFDLFLADDEDNPIYKSPVIPRGSELQNIVLDTPLSEGTYDGILIYHLIDEEQNTISTLRVGLTIIIES